MRHDEDLDAIEFCAGMYRGSDKTSLMSAIRETVTLLFREGCTLKQITDTTLLLKREKADNFLRGEESTDYLNQRDLQRLIERIGIMKNTPANRARWMKRFMTKQATFLCPKCGFSSNSFQSADANFATCPNCLHFDHKKNFKQSWAAGEKEKYDAEMEARRVKEAACRAEAEAARLVKQKEQQLIDERTFRIHDALEQTSRCEDVSDCVLWAAIQNVVRNSSLTDEDIIRLWDIVASNIPRDGSGFPIHNGRVVHLCDDDITAYALIHNSLESLNRFSKKEAL